MDNRDAFKNFIEKDGILYGTEPYAKDTKSTYLQRMDLFIEESKIDIYAINDILEIQKILKEKQDFIFNLSKSNMKRVLDWYIEFLLVTTLNVVTSYVLALIFLIFVWVQMKFIQALNC